LRLEYDRLRRLEKEELVRRQELKDEYERDVERRRLQEEKEMQKKLKQEQMEI